MLTEKEGFSINEEASVPLNENTSIPEPVKTKGSCLTFKVKLAIATVFVISICFGTLGLYYGLGKEGTRPKFTVRYI